MVRALNADSDFNFQPQLENEAAFSLVGTEPQTQTKTCFTDYKTRKMEKARALREHSNRVTLALETVV